MKLSIIIPCYKVEKYLDACLESVTQNKSEDIEIILVDDGSPDRVPQMCDEWAGKDNRIKVIHQKNGGLSVARNTGIDNSIGKYLWFIDSDDWITDTAISIVLALIEKFPNMEVFTFPLIWTYQDTRKNWSDIKMNKESVTFSGKEYMKRFPIGGTPRNIIKRDILKTFNLRFYPNILHEDGLFGCLLFFQTKTMMLLKDGIYYYRQRNNSIMHTYDIHRAYSMITMHQQLMQYIEMNISLPEQLAFRRENLGFISGAYEVVWPLRKTSEYRKFVDDTREYRIAECMKCAESGSLKMKWNMYMLAHHPITYIYINGWRRMLVNKMKKLAKSILKCTDIIDNKPLTWN